MKLRSTILIIGTYLSIQFPAFSQTNISGIINDYSEVTAVDFCNNQVAVADYLPFSVGDKVLLIQMQGADISLADDATYGAVSSLNDAGNYEILTIQGVNFNIISFQFTMQKMYDANAGVQLVRIPVFTDANITADIYASPWDGSKGGIVIFEVTGTLTFNANIDVTGMGLWGGGLNNHNNCYGGGNGYTGYRCITANGCGGVKGAGIATNGGFDLGRGAPANGGGGGNAHNTGGGGGANFGEGGQGGQRLNTSGADCLGDHPGIGGHALSYSNTDNKVFFGGGGGAGDEDNNTASVGANGGGICIIMANTINGNGQSIFTNGEDVAVPALSDGAGGGGGAGSVLLDVLNYNGNLNIVVEGGDGGDVNNSMNPDSCFGPGGGGSGGFLWHFGGSLPASVNITSTGGQPGTTINVNAHIACAGSSNGALPGQSGGTLNGLQVPQSFTAYLPLSGSASVNIDTICEGASVILNAQGSGTGGVTYAWSNGATGSTATATPTSSTVYSVSITDSRGCGIVDNSVTVTVLAIDVSATASKPIIIMGDSSQLQVQGQSGYIYNWLPDTALSNAAIDSPWASPSVTTTYCVTATNPVGCIDTACTTIVVEEPPEPEPIKWLDIPTAFSPNDDGVNDEFRILHSENVPIEIVEMKIFNRWGNLVHDSPEAWDGKRKDNRDPMPLSTYIYKISYRDLETGELTTVSGNVTLVH